MIMTQIISFFKIKNSLDRNADMHSYNTRNKNQIRTIKANNNISKAQKLFNKLPLDIRSLEDEVTFKRRLKECMINMECYNEDEFWNLKIQRLKFHAYFSNTLNVTVLYYCLYCKY